MFVCFYYRIKLEVKFIVKFVFDVKTTKLLWFIINFKFKINCKFFLMINQLYVKIYLKSIIDSKYIL